MSAEFKETEPKSRLLFHHGRRIEYCSVGEIFPPHLLRQGYPEVEGHYWRAYRWMEDQLGFTPVYFSVGRFAEASRLTGYPINDALFSFKGIDGVFSDYNAWEAVIYGRNNDPETFVEQVFRPDLTPEQWIQKSLQEPNSVQMMAPYINLADANSITVKYNYQKYDLIDKGFNARRIKSEQNRF